MLYKEDWEKSKERLEAFWHNEIVDRCCVAVNAPKKGSKYKGEPVPETDEELFRYNTDAEWILDRHIKKFENTYYGGEGFPCFWSNFGTAGHAKYFKGCNFKFTKETVWYKPFIQDWDKDALEYDPNCEILAIEEKVMKYLADAGKGKFFVTMPDNCGNIDALTHLRGTDNLLFDLLEEPDRVKDSVKKVGDALINASERHFNAIRENNDNGCTHGWMFTWSRGKSMQLQVDFSVMISPEMYEEFAMPELEAMTNWLDNSVYHLDGREQIRHLDMILSLKKLNAIQWTPVAGQPETSEFIPVLRKIQEAGKGLVLVPKKHEIEKLMTGLSSKGLQLVINDADDEEEAKAIIKRVAELTREKV
jgi:hypothetical protein